MNVVKKGMFAALTVTGICLGISSKVSARGSIFVKSVWSAAIEVHTDHEGAEVTLLPNPVYQRESEETIQLLESPWVVSQKEQAEREKIKACCGVSVGSEDRRILERIVEAEAGGETVHGRLLVANVVLNRVKSEEFPSTVKEVVFAHKGSKYQFAPVSNGRYYSVSVSEGTKEAVSKALQGKDPSRGALYFMERAYAERSSVTWFDQALTKLFRYGCHEFFR